MVMQARKLPRLSDGYFDRNQTHSFEGTGKYSKSNDREKLKGSPISSNSDPSSRNDISENKSSPRYHRPCSRGVKDKDHHEDSSKSPIVKNESKSGISKSQSSSDRDGTSDRYHSNHDRNTTEENEKRLPVIDWSEHISSSGKKYYYNCKTEVSQWEKPKELIEYERQQSLNRLAYDSNRSLYESNRAKERSHAGASSSKNSHSRDSVDNSMENSDHSEAPLNRPTNSSNAAQVAAHLLSPSQVTLANLPKLISQLAGTKGLPNLSELSPQEALRTIQQALQLTKQVTNLSQAADAHLQSKSSASPAQSQTNQVNHHPATTLSSAPSTTSALPVNSTSFPEAAATAAAELDRDRTSPGSDSSTHSVRHDSPTSSVSSLHSLNAGGTSSLTSAALKPSIPLLPQSMAQYYKDDMRGHCPTWATDPMERQADRLFEEGFQMTAFTGTQVSADLKMARALVRLAEIQATLQEQRILFLRQQIEDLEKNKNINNFTGDS